MLETVVGTNGILVPPDGYLAGVREIMPKVQQDMPAGIRVQVANDNSLFIDRSVKSVRSEVLKFRPDLSYLPAAR